MCSIKWLAGVHVLDRPFEGFYQIERYRVMNGPDADEFYSYLTGMKVKSIITDPAPGDEVPSGDYVVSGAAWSGESDITRIEVSTDGGDSWTDARVTVPRSGYSWTRWEHDWSIPGPGHYVLMSRATNDKGETQPMEFPNKWDGMGYGNNMVFAHEVEVV